MFYTFLNKNKNKLDRANAHSETFHANPPPVFARSPSFNSLTATVEERQCFPPVQNRISST